jgi:hypothetical protein
MERKKGLVQYSWLCLYGTLDAGNQMDEGGLDRTLPKKTWPGANTTIVSYNASVVNTYSTTSSLVRFDIKSIYFNFEKRSSLGTTTLVL